MSSKPNLLVVARSLTVGAGCSLSLSLLAAGCDRREPPSEIRIEIPVPGFRDLRE